jgi:hypothetical protein
MHSQPGTTPSVSVSVSATVVLSLPVSLSDEDDEVEDDDDEVDEVDEVDETEDDEDSAGASLPSDDSPALPSSFGHAARTNDDTNHPQLRNSMTAMMRSFRPGYNGAGNPNACGGRTTLGRR